MGLELSQCEPLLQLRGEGGLILTPAAGVSSSKTLHPPRVQMSPWENAHCIPNVGEKEQWSVVLPVVEGKEAKSFLKLNIMNIFLKSLFFSVMNRWQIIVVYITVKIIALVCVFLNKFQCKIGMLEMH